MESFRKIVCAVLVACLMLGIVPAGAMASAEAEIEAMDLPYGADDDMYDGGDTDSDSNPPTNEETDNEYPEFPNGDDQDGDEEDAYDEDYSDEDYLMSLLDSEIFYDRNAFEWGEKIHPNLWDAMQEASDDDIIPIYLWLHDIDHSIIDRQLANRGMDPAIFGDISRFSAEIVPQIAAQVESQMAGGLSAYSRDTGDNEAEFNRLLNEALHEIADIYIMERRTLVSQAFEGHNGSFIDNSVESGHERVMHMSAFAPFIIMEATRGEILEYAMMPEVSSIALYEEVEFVPNILSSDDFIHGFTRGRTVDLESDSSSNGEIYTGVGVRAAVLETWGILADPTAPMLSRAYAQGRLILHYDSGCSDFHFHGTAVASVLGGDAVTFFGDVYEGVAPGATIHSMGFDSHPDHIPFRVYTLFEAIEHLISEEVNIINGSFGIPTNGSVLSYTTWELAIDAILRNSNVVFVASAGNDIGLSSPALALNTIAAGCTHNTYSGFHQHQFLPNGPDIAANGSQAWLEYDDGGNITQLSGWGTSFSAPQVAGAIALMMEANPALKMNPVAVRANLLLAASRRADGAAMATDSQHLYDRFGAGNLNIAMAVTTAKNAKQISFFVDTYTQRNSPPFYVEAGQSIRAVMVYDKGHDRTIESADDMDIVDFHIRNAVGDSVASSLSDRNNVRIIEHTFAESGYYTFSVNPRQLITNIGTTQIAGVNVRIATDLDITWPLITISTTVVGGGSTSGYGTFQHGEEVTIIAVPNNGWIFAGWFENDVRIYDAPATFTFTVDAAFPNRTLEARFTLDEHVLDLSDLTTIENNASFNIVGNTVTYLGTEPLTILQSDSDVFASVNITVNNADRVNIENNTTINGRLRLERSGNVTVHGQGSDINIRAIGGAAIFARGNLTISGELGSVICEGEWSDPIARFSGSVANDGEMSRGISAGGSITISATIGYIEAERYAIETAGGGSIRINAPIIASGGESAFSRWPTVSLTNLSVVSAWSTDATGQADVQSGAGYTWNTNHRWVQIAGITTPITAAVLRPAVTQPHGPLSALVTWSANNRADEYTIQRRITSPASHSQSWEEGLNFVIEDIENLPDGVTLENNLLFSWTDTDLTAGFVYQYRIIATYRVDELGDRGGFDFLVTSTNRQITAATMPAPTGVTAYERNPTSITVRWNAITSPGLVGYYVYFTNSRLDDGWEYKFVQASSSATREFYTIDDLDPNTIYQVRVVGVWGETRARGRYSAVVNVSTIGPAPRDLRVRRENDVSTLRPTSVTLEWRAPANAYDLGVLGYRISRNGVPVGFEYGHNNLT